MIPPESPLLSPAVRHDSVPHLRCFPFISLQHICFSRQYMIKCTTGTELRQNSPKNSENHVKSPKTVKIHVKLAKNSVKSRYFALHQGGTCQIYDDEDSCRTN